MSLTVKVIMTELVEGIHLHHHLWERTVKNGFAVEVRLLRPDTTGSIPLCDYGPSAGLTENFCAVAIGSAWQDNFDIPGSAFEFDFTDANEAMLFKLTFGGS